MSKKYKIKKSFGYKKEYFTRDLGSKGSISYFFIFIMIGFISFSITIVNYARINSQRLNLDIIGQSTVDYALSKYDDWLYDKYKLLGVHEDEVSDSKIHSFVNFKAGEDSSHDFSQLKIDSIAFTKTGEYNDVLSFKKMIVKSHQNKFVISSLEEIIKKIGMFSKLKFGKNIMSEYFEVINEVGELNDVFSDLKYELEKGKELAGYIDSENIEALALEFIDISKKKGMDKRKKEIIRDVRYFYKMTGHMRKIRSLVENLEQDMSEAIIKLKNSSTNIKNLKSAEKDLIKEYEKSAKEMLSQLDEYIKKLRQSIKVCRILRKQIVESSIEFDKYERHVRKIMGYSKDARENLYQGTIQFYDDFDRLDIGKMSFFSSGENEDSIDDFGAFEYVKMFFNLVRGALMPRNNAFDTKIDRQVYSELPSKEYEKERIKFWFFPKRNDSTRIKNGLEDTYSILKNVDYNINKTSSDKLVERIITIDFILDKFTCNLKVDNSKKISKSFKNPLQNSEIEYILHGRRNSRTNVNYTDLQIYGIRFLVNSLNLVAQKHKVLDNFSKVLQIVTGELGYPIIYSIALISWTSIESIIDLNLLHDGKEIPFIKSSNEFHIDFSIERIKDIAEKVEKNELFQGNRTTKNKGSFLVGYKDYLFFLLITMDEEMMLYRTLDVIKVNAEVEKKKFDAKKIYTFFSIDIKAKIPMIYELKNKGFEINRIKNRGF